MSKSFKNNKKADCINNIGGESYKSIMSLKDLNISQNEIEYFKNIGKNLYDINNISREDIGNIINDLDIKTMMYMVINTISELSIYEINMIYDILNSVDQNKVDAYDELLSVFYNVDNSELIDIICGTDKEHIVKIALSIYDMVESLKQKDKDILRYIFNSLYTRVDPIKRGYINSILIKNNIIKEGDLGNMIDNTESIFDSASNINTSKDINNILEKDNSIFSLNTFNDLYNIIKNSINNDLISISQSVDSADPNKNSLFIYGDIKMKRPSIVIIPLKEYKVRIQVFNDPIYIYDEEYPFIDTNLHMGLSSIIRSFIENGNGYGILFKNGKVIL